MRSNAFRSNTSSFSVLLRAGASAFAALLLRVWVLGFALTVTGGAFAISLPAGFSEEDVGSLWTEPVGLAFGSGPQGADRIYVWERAGRVWILENGVNSWVPLLDIRDEVGAWRDYGMLGFALDPNFQQNGYIYVSYVVDRHHLLNAGQPDYDPNANEYLAATIGRVTRYTARASDGFRTVDPASRLVLVGETMSTGIPILHGSHGPGSLVFGTDGTLLVAVGDAASWEGMDDGGNDGNSYAAQGLIDGIIQAKEDVGAFRSQLLDSLNGKVLRLDPRTGNGLASNPFFDPTNPRSAKSRVWALGLRNPYRMTLRPETGSHLPEEGNPGVLVLGDVGWEDWEEVHVITSGGKNCGWP
jgi:glucose/arabinose dehydrogenase